VASRRNSTRVPRAPVSLLLSIAITLGIVNLWRPAIDHAPDRHTRAGIMDSIGETKNTVEGLGRFVGSIRTAVSAITGFFGFRAIVLFCAVLFVSMGLSQIGVPPGLWSFCGAMAIVNAIWLAWMRSFSPDSSAYLSTMLSANAMVLAPVAALSVIRWIAPRAFGFARRLLRSLPAFRGRPVSAECLTALLSDFQRSSGDLSTQLTRDILADGPDGVVLSSTSKKTLDEFDSIIEQLKAIHGK